MRLPILLMTFALLSTSACNTADLSYPPLSDSGDFTDVEVNDGCLDRCNGTDSAADAPHDAAADSPSTTDSAADVVVDAGDAGDAAG